MMAIASWGLPLWGQAAPNPATSPAAGRDATGNAAATGVAAATSCVPACREGFYCDQGRCVSACNPPCPANQVCVDGQRCEFIASRAPAPPVYEPAPPPTKPFGARAFSMLAFHWGIGGQVESNGQKRDLNSTLGVNLRADFPVAEYILIGPLFQFGAWRPNGDPNHNYYVDLDLFIRGRVPIELGDNHLQIWGGIPIGLSADILGNHNAAGVEDAGWGWNYGCLVGSAFHIKSGFGLFAELGWMQHRMSHSSSTSNGSASELQFSQWIVNLGLAFKN